MVKSVVIGCGRMGASPSLRWEGQVPAGWLPMSHAEVLKGLDSVTLAGLCDINQDLLKQCAIDYQVDHLFNDYRQLIDQIEPDLVSIATRTPLKAEIIEYACKKGVKGIYVEKPIATSIAKCASTLSYPRLYNTKLAYGVNRRYHAVYRRAKEMLEQDEIGEILEIGIDHGKAQLLWSQTHVFDLILFFLGSMELSTVQAIMDAKTLNFKSKNIIDSDPLLINALLTFSNGVTANITQSGGFNVRIAGTKGNLVIHGNGAYIQLNKKNAADSPYFFEQKIIEINSTHSATTTAMQELINSFTLNKKLGIELHEIQMGVNMMMACVWSQINQSQPVEMANVPEDLEVTGRYGELYA